jgi:hypothetical protein
MVPGDTQLKSERFQKREQGTQVDQVSYSKATKEDRGDLRIHRRSQR